MISPRMCSVDGCERLHIARGWCDTHYRRWRRRGDPVADAVVRSRQVSSVVSYGAALQRVRARRGPARDNSCATCGAVAALWSYVGADPDERRDARDRRYSLDVSRYRPSCRFCHRRTSVDRRAEVPAGAVPLPALDVERAVRLYRAGAAASGIAGLLRVSPAAVVSALRARNEPIRSRGHRTST